MVNGFDIRSIVFLVYYCCYFSFKNRIKICFVVIVYQKCLHISNNVDKLNVWKFFCTPKNSCRYQKPNTHILYTAYYFYLVICSQNKFLFASLANMYVYTVRHLILHHFRLVLLLLWSLVAIVLTQSHPKAIQILCNTNMISKIMIYRLFILSDTMKQHFICFIFNNVVSMRFSTQCNSVGFFSILIPLRVKYFMENNGNYNVTNDGKLLAFHNFTLQ